MAISQANVLYLIQIVQFIPDLVEADELDHNLILPQSFDVCFNIVFPCMLPSSQFIALFYFSESFTLFFLLAFRTDFDLLHLIVNGLRVVNFLSSEVALEVACL